MDKFARPRLWENNAEKIIDLATLIEPNWNDYVTEEQMLHSLDLKLSSAKQAAMEHNFVCLHRRCMTTLKDEHDVFRHCREKHPDDVLPNTSGEQRRNCIIDQGIRNMKDCATGNQLLILFSGINQDIRRNLMNAEVMTVAVAQTPNPVDNDFVTYPVTDVNLNVPDYFDHDHPIFANPNL